MKKIILISICLLSFSSAWGQLKGRVVGNNGTQTEKIYGAKIRSLQTKTTVLTNEEGEFEFIVGKNTNDTLIISAFGYHNDSLFLSKKDRFSLLEIQLYSEKLLPEIVIQARNDGKSISKLKTLHVETLGEGELRKAACCNLSESFETNASVDVNMTDAVSGAKKIQMMGLDGVYTQIQFENIPYLRGLESAFGMNAIPGTWIESIQITKGTGNVVNGHESMAGLINLELKKPENMERFYLNAYGSIFGRGEINLHGGKIFNPKWKMANFFHAATLQGEIDRNKDGFRDVPKSMNASFLNRWRYDGKKMEAQFGVNIYAEDKQGGQRGFEANKPNLSLFGVHIQNKHASAFAKTGFFFPKKPYQSIGIVYNVKLHETGAQFGNRFFHGTEKRAYVNALFDGIIGNTNHGIKVGISFVYNDIQQRLDSVTLLREEYIPGVFSEYTYKGTRFTYIAGIRADYHSIFGMQLSPRLHGKYSLTEHLDFRFTGGRGFRISNVMIDNISLLATSRAWVVDPNITPEVSWNVGGSLVYDFKFNNQKGTWSTDFYHTYFVNQLVVDRDLDMSSIYFLNLQGKSFSNSFQTEINLPLSKEVELRIAYKFLDVKAELGGEIQQQVMIPRHRGFGNIAYKTRNKRWEFDYTLSIYGRSRLHMVALPGNNESMVNESAIFPLMNTQITHIYRKWDFYLGVENLGNYIQKDAIIDASNPFGSYFDATRVWAPVQGIMIYGGLRYKLKK
jgi:outer membrane receptor for ferrienterochelin and colicins